MKQLTEFLKIGLGFERLFYFVLIFLLGIHLSACFWVITASVLGTESAASANETDTQELFTGTWMEKFDLSKMTDMDIYVVAIYWAVQTITTVGYGDVASVNSTERMFCAMMMVIGVIAFSFANGSLTSIMQNYDVHNAEYQSQLESLNKIYQDFKLPLDLFIRIKKSMGQDIKKDI